LRIINIKYINLLLQKFGNDWGICVDNIKYYCDHRNECLLDVSSDRKIAKTAFLKVAYGGNIKLHSEYCDENGIDPKGNTNMLKLIEIETKNLMEMCFVKYSKYHFLVKKKDNPKASLFALILQTEERKCILALDEYFKSVNRQVDILIHDGLEVRKLENEMNFPEILLRGGEQAILYTTNYKIKLVNKPFEHNFKFKQESNIIIDDIYAAKKFIELMNNNIIRDGDDVYYFNDTNGLWESNETAFRIAVNKHKDKLIFHDPETGKLINYGGIEKNVMSMKKWLVALLEDLNFITKNIDSSLGKLLFADGIYDFMTNTFIKGFNNDIIFIKRINRNFPEKKDEDLIKKVHDILFVDAFNDIEGFESGIYLKKSLCMALYGDYYRKKFLFSTGLSNCGKGLLVNAFRNAFDGYIDEFDANNLLYNQNSQDESKKLAWVKDLIGVRIAFSNECRVINNKGIDGNLLKALSSGSDGMKIRSNYESQQNFINRSTMFELANDVPPITPMDSGVNERVRFIRYKLHFVQNPTNPDERLADPEIKIKFQTDEYKSALFFVMIDTYNNLQHNEKCLGGSIIEPKCVIQETNEWIKDENTLFLEKLNEKYEITNNPNDYVESKKIIDYLTNECDLHMSTVKLGMILTKLIKVEPRDKNIKNKKCRLGIKEFKKDIEL